MARFFVRVAILGLFFLGAMARAEQPVEIDIRCGLAILSALQHLARQPEPGQETLSLNQYARANFRTITCTTQGDEAHVTLDPSGGGRGGGVYYRIGLEDFEVRERAFGR
jgi:hypothetical protein